MTNIEREFGARDRVRTGDPQLGKLMLYQLSYSRSLLKSTTYSLLADFVARVGPVVARSR